MCKCGGASVPTEHNLEEEEEEEEEATVQGSIEGRYKGEEEGPNCPDPAKPPKRSLDADGKRGRDALARIDTSHPFPARPRLTRGRLLMLMAWDAQER